MTVAYAPVEAWWFQIICLSGLFLLPKARIAEGFCIGFYFGLGWFSFGMWWVLPAIVRHSHTSWSIAFLLSSLLLVYLSLFPALAVSVLSALNKYGSEQPHYFLLRCGTTASVWALSEWFRGNLFSGFPWLATGYAQASGPLSSFASIAGIFGLTYLSALCAAMLASVCKELEQREYTKIIPLVILSLTALYLAGQGLQRIEWTEGKGTLRVRLMQGNLSQQDKFSSIGVRQAIHTYGKLMSDSQAELTVLPETAIPIEWHSQSPELLDAWRKTATDRNTSILVGTVISTQKQERLMTTNSAIAMMPGSSSALAYDYRYDKQHLLPFGEFFPTGSRWIESILDQNYSDFTSGNTYQAPLVINNKKIGVSICFENLFDIGTLNRVGDGDTLISISNFAWFLGSAAPAQHLQIARVRAIELGRWVVQASNTGRTAMIDQHGRIRHALEEDVTGVLDGEIQLMTGKTPFMHFRNGPILFICFLQIIFLPFVYLGRKSKFKVRVC
ncbi:apolipoprotein N-acyltransferase [Undibacterium sp. CY21W]|uniref:apolipoprotein N-acyltransferase n=1 Tax=Undibacterium sp. CY21W TaxID=2762293 RepID=UPI00164AC757|nr:apolipoprotein N-acyltransferase [Undibacterium sp. CY21W]